MRHSIVSILAATSSFAASQAYAQQSEPPAPAAPAAVPAPVMAPEPVPEPPAAMIPAAPVAVPPQPTGGGLVAIKNKWSVTLSGYFQADSIYDSTQSFTDAAAGTPVARPGSYAANNDRVNFGIRNSRFGLRFITPEVGGLRPSGFVEFDFLGNLTPPLTETQLFSNPAMRARHVYGKLESDYGTLLVGQTWHIFGWQPNYFPNTAALQGVPGQLFTRSMQVQLSRTVTSDAVNVDLAVAGVRPPQRDSGRPDGQGGVRLLLNHLKAFHVNGNGGSQAVDAASLGVSGLVRKFRVKEFTAAPAASSSATGWGLSVDALIPIIPVTSASHGNKLTVQGSFQKGSGFNDQYLGFTGGVTFPSLPIPMGATTAPAYVPNIDPGMVTYDAQGVLHTIDWTLFLVGLHYYLPPNGDIWLSANFSQAKSDNIASYGAAPASVYTKAIWFDGNIFWQVTAAVRFGLEYSQYRQTYADNVLAKTHRGQFSLWFLF